MPNAFIKSIGQQVTNFEDAVKGVSTQNDAQRLVSKGDSLFRELRAFIKETNDALDKKRREMSALGDDEETEDVQDEIDFLEQDRDDAIAIKDDMNDIARSLMEKLKQFNRMKK